MKLTIKKITKGIDHPQAWSWRFRRGREVFAGGYCATKKAAASDTAIWLKAWQNGGAL